MKEKLSYEKPVLTRLDGAAQGLSVTCNFGSIAGACPKGVIVKGLP